MLSPAQLRRNAFFHILDGIFFFAALALFSREVIMPKMIADLSESALLVGLVPLIYWTGYVLPQMIYAKKAEGIAYKKPAVIACAVLQRAGLLVFLLFMPALWGGPAVLVLFFCMLGASSFATGLIMPVWSDWYAKTVAESQWARLLGLRMAIFGFLVLPLGLFTRWVMGAFPAPDCYMILLGCALFFYLLSTLSLVPIHEEHAEGLPDHSGTSLGEYLRGMGLVVAQRRDFRLFIVANLVISVPTILLISYLTRYALTFPGVPDGVTGTFTTAYFVAMSVGSLVAGAASDRVHAMTPFRVFPAALVAGAACAYLASGALMITVAFCFLGLTLGAQMAVVGPAVYRFAGPHRRTSYSAVYFSLLGTSYAVAPAVTGVLLDHGMLTFAGMFLLCGVLALAGWLMFATMRPPSPAA